MPRFEFHLEPVLRHRKDIERQKQRDVAIVQAQMVPLQAELKRLDEMVEQATADLRQTRLIGSVDMSFIAAHRRFTASIQRKAMSLVQKMALVQRRLEEVRGELAEAAKNRRIMEKLRERHYLRWREALDRVEAQDLDEMTMQLSYRQLAARADEVEGVA
jgi:flagellar FliJ protein